MQPEQSNDPDEHVGEISVDEFHDAQRDPQVRRVLREAQELYDAYEPSGAAVGTLRDVLSTGGFEVPAGLARGALVAALTVEYERKRQKRPAPNDSDPRAAQL